MELLKAARSKSKGEGEEPEGKPRGRGRQAKGKAKAKAKGRPRVKAAQAKCKAKAKAKGRARKNKVDSVGSQAGEGELEGPTLPEDTRGQVEEPHAPAAPAPKRAAAKRAPRKRPSAAPALVQPENEPEAPPAPKPENEQEAPPPPVPKPEENQEARPAPKRARRKTAPKVQEKGQDAQGQAPVNEQPVFFGPELPNIERDLLPATFARRAKPNTQTGREKYARIVSAFNDHIRPHLRAGKMTRAEDWEWVIQRADALIVL